jgi:membrane associated rhomboid family serine protease
VFVLPVYRDDDDPPLLPVVLTLLLLSNSGIWLAASVWDSGEAWVARYGFTPARASVASAITSMFLHAGFWHVAGNMWFLWMLGRRVENTLGGFLFMGVYIVSGLGGAGLHFLLNRHAAIPCVGASGAISGVLGCFWVYFLAQNSIWRSTSVGGV